MTNKPYKKHVLVESYRTEKGPRQRVVMQLGSLTLPKSEWKKLAAALEGRLAGQITLFEDEKEIAEAAEQAMAHYSFNLIKSEDKESRQTNGHFVSVDLHTVSMGESRSLGPELVGHAIWNQLGLHPLLNTCGFTSKEQALAEAVVIGRLVAPSGDLASWRWLRERNALIELLDVDLSEIGKDAIYEMTDKLLEKKAEIEDGLRTKEASLFSRLNQVFLYDLTHTYFEGSALKNELAYRGKSKEKRMDCPLVTLALVVDDDGFPIFSQIYEGNKSEPETLEDILTRLGTDASLELVESRPMIIMDRGIATKNNLSLIKEKGFPYIVVDGEQLKRNTLKNLNRRKKHLKLSLVKKRTKAIRQIQPLRNPFM